MIWLAAVSFLAGALTVAAPCVLPLLPVVVGGSIARSPSSNGATEPSWHRPIIVAAALAVSVVAFTLLLKTTTALLGVPQTVWQIVAGGIVVLLGLILVFPHAWDGLMIRTGLSARTGATLDRSSRRRGIAGDILLGAALGPTFSSCSPTYALLVATILPASFGDGLLYVSLYAVGLAATLLAIAFVGQALVRRLGWLTRPDGWFRRATGILLIAVGIAVIFSLDRTLQAWILEQGWYEPIERFERSLFGSTG
jgi:cytochrome c biogenesis protein CcdA